MTIVLVFAPVGAVLLALAWLFSSDRVPSTVWFGGREPRSQRGRVAGERANRTVSRTLAVGGAIVLVAAAAAWIAGASLEDELVALILVGAVLATVVAALVRAMRLVRGAAAERQGRRGRR
jgi:hypothetical protein